MNSNPTRTKPYSAMRLNADISHRLRHAAAIAIWGVACVITLALAAGCSIIQDTQQTDAPPPILTEITPPCAGKDNACRQRNASRFDMFYPDVGGAMFEYTLPTTEEIIERGLHAAGASPVHLAVRGATRDGSVRCAWRTVARTPKQREEAVRFWLGIPTATPLPSPSELESTFNSYINRMDPKVREEMRTNFKPLAFGGVSNDALFLTCYVDYDVHEYLLGNGSNILTVAYDNISQSTSYALYKRSHAVGKYDGATLLTEQGYAAQNAAAVSAAEGKFRGILDDQESVVFLAPMGAHNAIAIEAWQAVAQWDLQTIDGVSTAVRYGADEQDAEYSQPLSAFKRRIAAAAAGDAFAGKRIANVAGLTGYYRGIGAYGNIGPFSSGASGAAAASFTPSQPPPPYGQSSDSTATPTPSLTPTETPSFTPTATAESTATPTPETASTQTPTTTLTPTATYTHTPTMTATATLEPPSGGVSGAAETPTPTHTPTATNTPTATHTPSPTATATPEPTATPTATTETQGGIVGGAVDEPTATATATDTPTPTYTPETQSGGVGGAVGGAVDEPTSTPTPTATNTPMPAHTPTATNTPTATHTPTPTATATPEPTITPTATLESSTGSVSGAADTPTPTTTNTPTATATHTPTIAPTSTPES